MSDKVRLITVDIESVHYGRDTFRVDIPVDPVSLAALIPPLEKIFDKIIPLELHRKPVSCGSGCSACCHQLVPISLPEAFFIQDVLSTLSPKKRKVIKRQIASILKKVEDGNLISRFQNPRENEDIERIYYQLGILCPFLEGHRCGIYEHRPLACREYHVSSPKRLCQNPYDFPIQRVCIQRNMAAVLAIFASRLYGIPKDPIPLFLFLSYADRNHSLREKKWPGGWIVRKILDGLRQLNNEELSISVRSEDEKNRLAAGSKYFGPGDVGKKGDHFTDYRPV